MSQAVTQTISSDDLMPGMVLAEDVFSSVGLRLFKQGTELDDKSIAKIRLYDIDYVLIYEDVNIDYVKVKETEVESKSIRKMQEFKAFKSSYTKNVNTLQDYITHIGEGKNVSITDLFSISQEIVSEVQTKSDILAFMHNLKLSDDYTYTHSVNVSLLCNIFGQWLGFDKEKLKNITVAGLIHDIGKVKIDPNILNKPGKLTPEEFEEIKKHPVYGYRMVQNQDIHRDIKLAVLMHHEKYDGTGYPTGAKSNQINEFAKIVAIADIYDAMTSNRSYRDRFCPFKVIQTFEQECYGKLDTEFLLIFLKNIAYNYLNCWVRLSSGEEGEIVFINQNNLSRPIVSIDNVLVDLSNEKDLTIEELI